MATYVLFFSFFTSSPDPSTLQGCEEGVCSLCNGSDVSMVGVRLMMRAAVLCAGLGTIRWILIAASQLGCTP